VNNEELEARLETIGTRECRLMVKEIIEKHKPVGRYLQRAYVYKAKDKGYVQANKLLRQLDEKLTWKGYSVTIGLSDIEDLSEKYASVCTAQYGEAYERTKSVHKACIPVRMYVHMRGIKDPFPKNWASKPEKKLLSIVKRLSDERWWKRTIRKILNTQVETVLRDLGYVKKQTAPYISNFSLAKYKQGRVRQGDYIDSSLLVSEDGEYFPLRQAVDGSVSNPIVQRAELMTRMRGVEDVALELKLTPLFITMSCPSKYHAYYGMSGRLNPKYEGLTPKNAQDYLLRTFSQIRADLHKKEIRMAGFRISEPHHDGTPHFHLLLYVHPEHAEAVSQVFTKHCLKEDGDEKGALENRCDVKTLDLEKGSPTGYIAKYIAKNIDGDSVGVDHESGEDSASSSLRVKAWASIWGIRQFQPIGNTPQTIYREFRRLPKALTEEYPKQAEQARKAADEGDYAEFIRANGGLFVSRKDLPFRAMHVIRDIFSQYGEEVKKRVGIKTNTGHQIITRTVNYMIMPAMMVLGQKAAQPPPLEYCQ
jgi:hypothetical protein